MALSADEQIAHLLAVLVEIQQRAAMGGRDCNEIEVLARTAIINATSLVRAS